MCLSSVQLSAGFFQPRLPAWPAADPEVIQEPVTGPEAVQEPTPKPWEHSTMTLVPILKAGQTHVHYTGKTPLGTVTFIMFSLIALVPGKFDLSALTALPAPPKHLSLSALPKQLALPALPKLQTCRSLPLPSLQLCLGFLPGLQTHLILPGSTLPDHLPGLWTF